MKWTNIINSLNRLLVRTKPLHGPWMGDLYLDIGNNLQWNWNQYRAKKVPSTDTLDYVIFIYKISTFWSLHWRHNDHGGVSNHQPHDCLLNRLFRRRSKKTSKLRVTGLCMENSTGIGEFPVQRASNAENISIWWRHHEWSPNMLISADYNL